jgi:LmbE family N-acetylglucosaminyl deacetylase
MAHSCNLAHWLYLAHQNSAMRHALLMVISSIWITSFAQPIESNPRSSESILIELHKLKNFRKILYLAAHPDDENTRLIAWLENHAFAEVAYLSLTRGDGGQNLIGTEKGIDLGMLRTQELLQAREVDGAQQFFTRALDFGYSPSTKETLEHWDKQKILGDVVAVIRKFKPDVIITRFPSDSRGGHGHHSTSALLAEEAFDIAADATQFPKSASMFGVWQPKQLYWNHSTWWDKTIAEHREEFVIVDIGSYNPLLGKAYSEIASQSRSQHRSQGFGSSVQRGSREEFLKLMKSAGELSNPFESDDEEWNNLINGEAALELIDEVIENFMVLEPEASIEGLVKCHKAVSQMEAFRSKNEKLAQIESLILSCSGTYIECITNRESYTTGEDMEVTLGMYAQAGFPWKITKASFGKNDFTLSQEKEPIPDNQYYTLVDTFQAPSKRSQPYWLENNIENDLFDYPLTPQFGIAELNSLPTCFVTLSNGEIKITAERPVRYKWTDRSIGELKRNPVILPEVEIDCESFVLLNDTPVIKGWVLVNSDLDSIVIQPMIPSKWRVEPSQTKWERPKKGQKIPFQFKVMPIGKLKNGRVDLLARTGSAVYGERRVDIAYDHIIPQSCFEETSVKVVGEKIEIVPKKVAYVMGSGDDVPKTIELLGAQVDLLNINNLSYEELIEYQVIIYGIRAFNIHKEFMSSKAVLTQYVQNGGLVVVQYQTSRGVSLSDFLPAEIKLSRYRVTNEYARTTILDDKHPIFNFPNTLSDTDFDDWVQERGLYFAEEWGPEAYPLISWQNEKGKVLNGGLVVMPIGKGNVIYTGISFFRQLPAGVPGAIKLFANILSYTGSNE